jgi:hypothetical protein
VSQKKQSHNIEILNCKIVPATAVNINIYNKWDVATVGQVPAVNQVVAKEMVDVRVVDATG